MCPEPQLWSLWERRGAFAHVISRGRSRAGTVRGSFHQVISARWECGV